MKIKNEITNFEYCGEKIKYLKCELSQHINMYNPTVIETHNEIIKVCGD